MEPSDRPRFAQAIAGLCVAFNRPADELLFRTYESALSDLSIEAIEAAALQILRTGREMPVPGAIRDAAAGGKPSDLAEIAWESLLNAIRRHGAYSSVMFDDPALAAAIRGLGGWQRICDLSSEELHSYARHAFLQAYRAWSGRSADLHVEEMPGLLAIDPNGRALRVRIKAPYLPASTRKLISGTNGDPA